MNNYKGYTNTRSHVPFANDTNFEERDTNNYRSKNTSIKQGDLQLIHPSITYTKLVDSYLLYPNTPSSKPDNSDFIHTVPDSKNVFLTVSDSLNHNNPVSKKISTATESLKINNTST